MFAALFRLSLLQVQEPPLLFFPFFLTVRGTISHEVLFT
jgi:hypothetical protein